MTLYVTSIKSQKNKGARP